MTDSDLMPEVPDPKDPGRDWLEGGGRIGTSAGYDDARLEVKAEVVEAFAVAAAWLGGAGVRLGGPGRLCLVDGKGLPPNGIWGGTARTFPGLAVERYDGLIGSKGAA